MENSPTTSEHSLSPRKDLEKSPLVKLDGNAEEMPEFKLDDGKKAAVDPMSFEKNEDGDHALTVDNGKCLGKYEYGTKPWHIFMYAPELYKADKAQLLNEVAAGLTVAFAQVSESVAFAFIAGVGPLLGLHAAWIIGLSLSFFGSRPGMINGATGVRAAVIAPYIVKHGTAYLFYIVLMISVFQLVAGLLQLAKFVRLVPRSVMIGFVNGLAIILTLGQTFTFKDRPNPNVPLPANTTMPKMEDIPYISDGTTLGFMFMHVALVALIIVFVPKIPKYGKNIPASLVGLMFVTFIEWVFLRPNGVSTPVIGEVSKVKGGFPVPFFLDPQYTSDLPPLSLDVVGIVAFPAFIASAAGAVEAVMTMEVVNDLTETTNEAPNQQLIALSIGNFISGIYGTMGGGATIGLSVINCTSGANGIYRLSGIVAGIAVLIFILIAAPFIEALPTASLVGVMVIVIHGTFDWESLQIIFTTFMPLTIRKKIDNFTLSCCGKKISFSGSRKIKRTDAITIILVTVVTLVQDLFVAVALGIVFTATAFAWEIGSDARVTFIDVEEDGKVIKRIYNMHGPLFFASAQKFVTFFNPKTDPELIEIHFLEQGAILDDFSAIHALNVVGEKYGKYDKQVVVRHLKFKSAKLTTKAAKLIKTFSIASGEEKKDEVISDEVEEDVERNSGDIMVNETKSTDVNVDVTENTSTITVVETEVETLQTDQVHRRNIVNRKA
eukprot:g204.t1